MRSGRFACVLEFLAGARIPLYTANWSDKPLLKSYQKSKPPLGWPRETDSLCPRCIPEIRKQILEGKQDYAILLDEKPGEIKAQVIERDGRILMVKDCPVHGHFEDVMSIDPAFFAFGADVPGPRHPRPQRRKTA
jgi:7,8-dihydro-6-hydroxymethylpterin dimethyltransferase